LAPLNVYNDIGFIMILGLCMWKHIRKYV